MRRKAFLISGSANQRNPLPSTKLDVHHLREFLKSDIGGAWEDPEIVPFDNPDESIIDSLKGVDYDYTITMISGHGGICRKDSNLYLEINNIDYKQIDFIERIGSGQLMITTTSAYDSLHRLSSLTDSNGGVTSYEYDSENRILKETYPDNGTVEYTYDLKGRLLTKTDQAGELCTYTYDSRDLLTQKSYGATGVQTFTYDALGRMTGSTDNNGGGTAISHSSSKTFDALGRMLTNSQIVGTSPVRILSKEYDAFGHVVKCTRPSGQVVEYTYTNLHQIDEITTDLGNGPEVVQNYDYLYENSDTDNRPLIDKRYHAVSTGLVLNRTYDAVGRTTTHDWQKADATVTGFTYTYDLYGNRLSDTHLHNSADSESYTFDTANRLSAYDRQSGFNQEWTLDDLGNWSSFNDNGVTENRTHNAANEIETKGTDTLEHDAKGNLTKVITDIDNYTTYTWDTLNRLTKVEKTELGVIKLVGQYAYSPENMRVYKAFDIDSDGDIDGQDIHQEFAYCGNKVIEEYYVGSILPSMQYFYSPEYVDEAFMFIDGVGNAKYKLNDIRYSVYAFVDSAGAVQERYKYDPYGKQYTMDANYKIRITTAVAQDYGFTGRRFDRESGLYYFRARYYDAELGRFIGRDPLRYVDGMSLYNGCFVPWGVDPFGLSPEGEKALKVAKDLAKQNEKNVGENKTGGLYSPSSTSGFWGVGSPKCNKFVNDSYNDANGNIIKTGILNRNGPTAYDYYHGKVPGFKLTTNPKPGDIIASYNHLGLVSDKAGMSISASSNKNGVIENNWGFRKNKDGTLDKGLRAYEYTGSEE